MRRVLPALVAVVVAAIVGLLSWLILAEEPPPPREGGAVESITVSAPSRSTSAALEAIATTEGAGERAAIVDESADVVHTEVASDTSTPDPTCIVFGTVVDTNGAPLAGIEVAIGARVWHADVATTNLPWRGGFDGFVTTSDANGAFRFEVVPPQNVPQKIVVGGDPFLRVYEAWFGAQASYSFPAITAGELDLGALQLVAAGTISGRVVDVKGAPIEGVDVGVGPTEAQTFGLNVTSRADGTFVLAHVPVGTCFVSAKAARFEDARPSSVVVESGRDTSGVELVLTDAATIEGVVRDANGAPLENARLVGWGVDAGGATQARSGADGSFVLYLRHNGPHTLAVTLDGFERWGDEHDRSTVHQAGTRDLAIVLTAMEPLRIEVVDAVSGERLTRFGLNLLRNNGAASRSRVYTERRRPLDQDRADGVAEIFASPGEDLLLVAADGYLMSAVELEAPVAGAAQVVRLSRSGRVSGRVWRDGAPVANANVVLRHGDIEVALDGMPGVDAGSEGDGWWFRADRQSARRTTTDDEGRFEIDPEDSGTCQLIVDVGAGQAVVRAPIAVTSGAVLDLGDLHASATGRIEGQVVVGAGIDAAGLVVQLDQGQDGVQTLVDAAGRFVFESVAPGGHLVDLRARRGVLDSGPGRIVEVVSNGTVNVEFDARERMVGHVELHVDLVGHDPNGVRVTAWSADNEVHVELGTLDGTGMVRGDVRAGVPLHAALSLPHSTLRCTDQPFTALPHATTEATVRVELGEFVVYLPPGLELPEVAEVQLDLTTGDESSIAQGIRFKISNGVAATTGGAGVSTLADGHAVSLVLVGTYTLNARIVDPRAERERIDLGNGRIQVRQKRLHESSHTVTITAGQRSEVRL